MDDKAMQDATQKKHNEVLRAKLTELKVHAFNDVHCIVMAVLRRCQIGVRPNLCQVKQIFMSFIVIAHTHDSMGGGVNANAGPNIKAASLEASQNFCFLGTYDLSDSNCNLHSDGKSSQICVGSSSKDHASLYHQSARRVPNRTVTEWTSVYHKVFCTLGHKSSVLQQMLSRV